MALIPIRDILANARQESVQLQHHYLGVEHLFIAMLQIRGGITASLLEEQGLHAEYVMDAVRRRAEKGTAQRLWVGIPYTPRTLIILDIANDLAADAELPESTEREILSAILAERDSLPIRVLKRLNVDIEKLIKSAQTYTPIRDSQPLDIRVEFGDLFDPHESIDGEQLFVLRRIFNEYTRIRVDRRLTGFRNALILVVTPIQADGREDSAVVVKIDQSDNILDEYQRYESFVKMALPLQTARLEDRPVAPESSRLAGLKYTLVASGGAPPLDLRTRVQMLGTGGLGGMLHRELYEQFRRAWWQQKRPYRFQAWQEYDWLMPPVLTIDVCEPEELPANPFSLRVPVNRARLNTKMKFLQCGDPIVIENFVVQRIDRDNGVLKLAAGYGAEADKRAYRIDVRGCNFEKQTYYRGQTLDRVVGKVWKTRLEMMADAMVELEPDFDFSARTIPCGDLQLPNPILLYEDMLERYVNGSMSKIHGDMHLGNIIAGPNQSLWLIDFGQTRDGHTLFDWASLEISMLGDGVMPLAGVRWDIARQILACVAAISSRQPMPLENISLLSAMSTVSTIRDIARECLTTPDDWSEYFIAVALCALRAITWKSMPLGGRRLMFLLSGLAIHEVLNQENPSGEKPSADPSVPMTDRFVFSVPGLTPPKTELLSDEENFTLRDKRRDKKL
jgi:hypothetical protein